VAGGKPYADIKITFGPERGNAPLKNPKIRSAISRHSAFKCIEKIKSAYTSGSRVAEDWNAG